MLWLRDAVIAYYLLLPLGWTLLQWEVWHRLPFGRILLALPLDPSVPFPSVLRPLFSQPGGYFAHYVLERFWFPSAVLFVSVALLSYALLLLNRARPGSISKMETHAVTTGGLLCGWPLVILYVPLLFIVAFAHGTMNHLHGHEKTSLVAAVIVATIAVLLAGPWLVSLLHLWVLRT